MTYQQKDNTFSAFKNKRKEDKNHADLTGTMLLDGKEYWVNIWKKTDKNQDTWLSGSIRPKVKSDAKQTKSSYAPEDENEIPF